MATSNIQIQFEIGHTALYRPNDLAGTTHDWVVFLRSPKGAPDISPLIRKVVFHLHNSFQLPVRVVDKPPYEVRESGYAGFMLPIEIHFAKPPASDKQSSQSQAHHNQLQKVRYDYDLAFNPSESCNYLQIEKVTFQSPYMEFRRALLNAGGVGLLETDIKSVAPGRPLIQAVKHSGPNDRIAKRTSNISSFEEFAELFGLKLGAPKPTQTQSKTDAPKETPRNADKNKEIRQEKIELITKPSSQNTFQSMSSSKNQKSSTYVKPSVSPKPKIRPAAIIPSSMNDKPKDPAVAVRSGAVRNSPNVASSSRFKDRVIPSQETPKTETLSRLGVPSSVRVSPRPISPPSPIAKKSTGRRNSQKPIASESESSASEEDQVFIQTLKPGKVRRGSTGFRLPKVDGRSHSPTQMLEHVKNIAVSELSGEESSDDFVPDLSSVRLSKKTPIQPVSSDDDEETPEPFHETPPRILTEYEEDERYRLQCLLNQLEDRLVIQRIVDVLDPLGAFAIDQKAGTFSFNLYMLDNKTYESIRDIADFDSYIFDDVDDFVEDKRNSNR